MNGIGYDDFLNVAFILKRFLLLVQKVEPKESGDVEAFYLEVDKHKYILLDEYDILSVNKILHKIDHSIKVENNKLIIENKLNEHGR